MEAWRRLSAYFSHPDPRLAIGTLVALIVVGNQPFYPFYVRSVAGTPVLPAFLTWLSTPAFALAPAAMRRAPTLGRTLLLGAAFLNTLISAKALGTASGVELFYLPCVALGVLMAPRGRGWMGLLAGAAGAAAGLALGRLDGPPLQALTGRQAHDLSTMHAVSVGCLCLVLAYRGWRLGRDPVSRTA